VTEVVAVVAPRLAQARRAAAGPVAARRPAARFESFSLAGYGRAAAAPSRVVLWAAGDAASSLAFLRRARERLLWPAAGLDFGEAIAGLRGEEAPDERSAPHRPHRRGERGLPAALLIEGVLDARRIRRALAARAPRDWILESARRLRVSDRDLRELARRRIRIFALEPVTLVAVVLPAALARQSRRWRRLVPAGAEVWTIR